MVEWWKNAENEVWKTCRQMQVECKGCGKMDSCTVSPDLQVFKCWRHGGELIRNPGETGSHCGGAVTYGRASYTTLQHAADVFAKKLGTLAGCWTYTMATGQPCMGVLRFNGIEGKTYRPFHLTPEGWVPGDPPASELVLYRLPDVVKAQRVFVCEGEKACEAGRVIDIVTTTSAHGASAARRTDWTPLAGKEVIILPDNDEPGKGYAQEVARICLSLSPPAKVMIVELPGLKQGDDLFDWSDYLKEATWEEKKAYIGGYVAQGKWITQEDLPNLPKPNLPESGPVLVHLAEVKPEPIRWLWEGKLALGKLAGWAGAPGDGKSVASMDVAARVSTGAAWPDGGNAIAGSVLLITTEDGLADTIRPRLDAHGANIEKVHHFSMVKRVHNGRAVQELFTLGQIGQLEKSLEKVGDCRLVIIDPVGSFFGTDNDSNGDAAVRSVLAPIGVLAEKYNVAILLIMHTRKEAGDRADDAVMGSRAFTGIVRCMWHIRRDDNTPERRLFLPGKNNAAKALTGLAYKVVDCNGTAKVEWEPEPVQMTADDAVKRSKAAESPGENAELKLREEIQQWLERQLQGGPKPAGNPNRDEAQPGTLLEEAKVAGYAWRTVQRAASLMGVMRAKQGAVSVWLLPSLGE